MKFIFTLFLLFLPLAAQDFDPFDLPSAQAAPDKIASQTTLQAEVSTIAPGEPFAVVLTISHPEKWHSYYLNTGLIGEIFTSSWSLPDGFVAEYQGWPTPHLSSSFGYQTIGYEGTVSHLFTITPPETLAVGETAALTLEARWQICNDTSCVSEKFEGTLNLPVGERSEIAADQVSLFEKARSHYPQISEEIEVTAAENDNVITLSISGAGKLQAEGLRFFDEDGQVDVQKPHTATQEGDTIVLQVPRNLGTDISGAGPVKPELRGILTDGSSSFLIQTPLQGVTAAAISEPSGEVAVTTVDSPEAIAEMAKLYDPSTKINFVTLGKQVETTLWTALFGAFVGGILLNLMPCVFPVLGLKVMGFVEQAGNDSKKIRLHGLAFTAGLVAAMWVLAGIILFLKLSLGREVNWGQQMGNSYFVGAIIILLFVLGLNMAGVFEMGTSLTSAGQKIQKKGYSGSFFSGILTTLIATPCSGPFLGAAMSYTLAQPAGIALFLFTIFALGIAFPYLLLSFFPALINKLPRPGAWMETFKVTMSFALFATVAFFMKTFGAQTGVDGLGLLLMGLVILGLALYFFGRWTLPHLKASKRLWQGKVLPLAIAGGGLYLAVSAMRLEPPQTALAHGWESWHPGKVEMSRSKNRIVWVDYTADW